MSIKLMSLVFESDLAPSRRLLLLAMADYASDSGESVFPSVETLTKKTGLSRGTIIKAIGWLEENGYIVKYPKASRLRTNQYKINPERLWHTLPEPPAGAQIIKKKGGTVIVPSENQQYSDCTTMVQPLYHDGTTTVPNPSLTVTEPLGENSAEFANDNLKRLSSAIAIVTKLSLKINGKYIRSEAVKLSRDEQVTPDLILQIYGEGGAWYKNDWRGKKGEPPTVGQIGETFLKLMPQAGGRVIKINVKKRERRDERTD